MVSSEREWLNPDPYPPPPPSPSLFGPRSFLPPAFPNESICCNGRARIDVYMLSYWARIDALRTLGNECPQFTRWRHTSLEYSSDRNNGTTNLGSIGGCASHRLLAAR